MPDLQELIIRGRFVMANAPGRLAVFENIDGKSNANEIASKLKKHPNNVRRDLTKLLDAGLIEYVLDKSGDILKKNSLPIFQKIPLARTVPIRYFTQPSRLPLSANPETEKNNKISVASRNSNKPRKLPLPSENEILEYANIGESQTVEFKSQGVEVKKITREIAAMLNSREGGIILYGIDDDGNIQGSDVSVQKLDQPLQNSIRNTIQPAATVTIRSVDVLGSRIVCVIVPPWDRKSIFQYDGKILIRKGTNVFVATPDELRKLHAGQSIT